MKLVTDKVAVAGIILVLGVAVLDARSKHQAVTAPVEPAPVVSAAAEEQALADKMCYVEVQKTLKRPKTYQEVTKSVTFTKDNAHVAACSLRYKSVNGLGQARDKTYTFNFVTKQGKFKYN